MLPFKWQKLKSPAHTWLYRGAGEEFSGWTAKSPLETGSGYSLCKGLEKIMVPGKELVDSVMFVLGRMLLSNIQMFRETPVCVIYVCYHVL